MSFDKEVYQKGKTLFLSFKIHIFEILTGFTFKTDHYEENVIVIEQKAMFLF